MTLGVPIDYVLHQLEPFEAELLCRNGYMAHRQEWEQTRFNAFVMAQINSTKRMKIDDIIKFSWDGDTDTHTASTKSASEADIKRLTEKAKRIEAWLKKKK